MREKLFMAYYLILLAGGVAGLCRFKALDYPMRVLLFLQWSIILSETISFYLAGQEDYYTRNMVYHISCIVRLMLLSHYFIAVIQPHCQKRIMLLSGILWPLLGVLNMVYFQPVHTLNSNMTMLECWVMIILSLYSMYRIFKNAAAETIFSNPHFRIAAIWLTLGSATFFFWSFLSILYRAGWAYIDALIAAQISIDGIAYAGIAIIFLFYPEKKTS